MYNTRWRRRVISALWTVWLRWNALGGEGRRKERKKENTEGDFADHKAAWGRDGVMVWEGSQSRRNSSYQRNSSSVRRTSERSELLVHQSTAAKHRVCWLLRKRWTCVLEYFICLPSICAESILGGFMKYQEKESSYNILYKRNQTKD